MSTSPREIGTLIVVILKARNLPNKRHIGKQDPYCLAEFNGRKIRTKVIKRGGQHPEWDEEIRFTLYDADTDDIVAVGSDGTTAPPPPPKKSKDIPNVQGGKYMHLACYAQDIKEPDLIGETRVDLTEVLTKGETDEWFTLMNKDRYSGEVYLELTFWSNEPAPAKKAPVKAKAKKQYGGPGSFTAHTDARGSTESLDGGLSRWSPSGSRGWSGSPYGSWRQSSTDSDLRPETLPPTLRSSSSIAQIGLYRPSYETTSTQGSSHSSLSAQQSSGFTVNALTDEMGQMNLRRRLSLPQITHSELIRRSTSSSSSSNYLQIGSVGYNHSIGPSHSDDGSVYDYDRGEPSVGSAYPVQQQDSGPNLYHAPYEPVSRASSVYSTQPPQARGPRHSLPTSSSGFVPINTPTPSSFSVSQNSMYAPSVSATPAPSTYGRMSVPPPAAPTPAPSNYGPLPVPTPTSTGFRPPSAAPTPALYPTQMSHTPAPSSPFSAILQQYSAPPNHLPPTTSHQSIPQSQSTYSYQSYPTSSSISSNSAYSYQQPPTPPSASSTSSLAQYHHQPSQSFQQSSFIPPPPPLPPASTHPSQGPSPQQHALPQVPPAGAQSRAYSVPPEHRLSQLSTASSQMMVNVPPPPPLNPSPSQSHNSRPLPEVPAGGQSPVKRQPTMSMAMAHAVTAGPPSIQPSVSYPSYSQIPPPPPLQTSSTMSSVSQSPQTPTAPHVPENRRLSYQQPVSAPPQQPPQRAPSAQALYHNAVARQSSLGSNPLPPPPPPPLARWQPQSAYEALQQQQQQQQQQQPQPWSHGYVPPPPVHSMNGNSTYSGQLQLGAHPGSLPVPPRLPPNQQYSVANDWQ